MSYRRSPTCRFCHDRGHTRRFCPSLIAKAAEAAAKPVEQRDYHEAWAVQTHESNVAKAAAPRLCSYCNETGHNRSGCKVLKADIVRLSDLNRRWKQHIVSWLASDTCPVKVGALLSYNTWQGIQYTCIALEVNPDFWKHNITRLFDNNFSNWFVRGTVLSVSANDRYGSKAGDTINFCAPAGEIGRAHV